MVMLMRALAAVVVAAGAAAAAQETPEQVFKACRDGTSDINVLLGVPRRGLSFQSVSADLGEYASVLEMCPDGQDGVCTAPWVEELGARGLDLVRDGQYASDNPESWVGYFQSLFMYSAVAISFAVIAVVAGIGALCCLCCCCRGKPELYEDEEGELHKPDEYPVWQTVTTYACLVFFIILVFTFTMLGHIRGNQGLLQAQLALLQAPDNLVNLTQNIASPAVSLVTAVVGSTGTSLLRRVNTSLAEGANLEQVHVAFDCARDLLVVVQNETKLEIVETNLNELEAASQQGIDQAVLDDAFGGVDASLAPVNSSLVATDNLLTQMRSSLNALPLSGIESNVTKIDTSLNDLGTQLRQLQTSAGAYAALESGAADTADSIDPLIDIDSNIPYTQDQVRDFRTAFASFRIALSTAPDEEDLITDMQALDGSLNVIGADLLTLLGLLEFSQATIDAMPTVGELLTSVQQLRGALNDLDLDQVRADLQPVLEFGATLPSADPIRVVIGDYVQLEALLPCIMSAAPIPALIDAELIQLPPDLLNITDSLDMLNQTLRDASAELEQVLVEIEKFENSVNSSVETGRRDIDTAFASAKTAVNDARAKALDLENELSAFDQGAFNLQDAIDDVRNVLDQVNSPDLRLTPDAESQLRQAKTTRGQLQSMMNGLDATTFGDKVDNLADNSEDDQTCENTVTPCYTRSPTETYERCPGAPLVSCNYPVDEWTELQGALRSFAGEAAAVDPSISDDILPKLGETIQKVDDTDLTCCDDMSEIRNLQTEANEGGDSLAAARVEIDSVLDQLNDIRESLGNLDTAETAQTFIDARAQLDTFRAEVIEANFTTFEEVLQTESRLNDLVYSKLGAILDSISQPALEELAEGAEGLTGAALRIGEALDAIAGSLQPGEAALKQTIEESVAPVLRVVDASRDTDGKLKSEGSIYYLQQMAGAASNDTAKPNTAADFSQYDNPALDGYLVDGKMVAYPNGEQCLTDTCLRNTIQFYNAAPLADVLPAEISEATVSIPLSRSQATSLPYIISAVIIIMAVCVFCLPSCGYALACCSVCTMPFLFIIVGAIFFPLLVMTADVCAGAENVGVTALEAINPYICSQINGTFNDATSLCAVEVAAPPLVKTVEIDAPEIFKSLVKECAGRSTANGESSSEPVEALIASFGKDAAVIVKDQFVLLLDDILPSAGVVLRQRLRDDFLASSGDLEANVRELSDNLADVIGCKQINDAYIGVKDAFCCDMSQALYWSFAVWYLIAFTLLFLGLPLGCFAATRLRNLQRSREHMRIFYAEAHERMQRARERAARRVPTAEPATSLAGIDSDAPRASNGGVTGKVAGGFTSLREKASTLRAKAAALRPGRQEKQKPDSTVSSTSSIGDDNIHIGNTDDDYV